MDQSSVLKFEFYDEEDADDFFDYVSKCDFDCEQDGKFIYITANEIPSSWDENILKYYAEQFFCIHMEKVIQ